MIHAELPVGAFLAAILVLIPLPWHWRARNVATLSIIAWLFVCNVIFGINSVIWAGNVRIVASVWCDIATKIQVGSTMALPACCLCLCIHLERIASLRQVGTTLVQRRRRMIFDILMCWLLPMIHMALHYIVQGHRYDIVEDFGCRPAVYNSLQSIFLSWTLPLVIVVLTLIYAGLSLMHFFRQRITFARHLQNSNSALTTSRYFRLMAMAVVQMFWGASIVIINMWFTVRNGLRPWISWADVHSNFSRVAQFPTILIPRYVLQWTYVLWWAIPISSFLFFVFFAFGEDALKEYRACIAWLCQPFARRMQAKKLKSIPIQPPTPSPYPKLDIGDIKTESGYPSPSDDSTTFIITPTDSSFSDHTSKQKYSRNGHDMA